LRLSQIATNTKRLSKKADASGTMAQAEFPRRPTLGLPLSIVPYSGKDRSRSRARPTGSVASSEKSIGVAQSAAAMRES